MKKMRFLQLMGTFALVFNSVLAFAQVPDIYSDKVIQKITRQLAGSVPYTESLAQQEPPLTPVSGGRSIDRSALKAGDLVFSTTNKPLSWLIRFSSGDGPVSHVAIVAEVTGKLVFLIEAVGSGVRKVELEDFLQESTIAVAFRYPKITADQVKNIMAPYLNARIGAQYDTFGAMASVSPVFRFNDNKVEVDYGQFNSKKTYCSKLVLEAFKSLNIDLSAYNGNWSPNGLVTLYWTDLLNYIGHLKY